MLNAILNLFKPYKKTEPVVEITTAPVEVIVPPAPPVPVEAVTEVKPAPVNKPKQAPKPVKAKSKPAAITGKSTSKQPRKKK